MRFLWLDDLDAVAPGYYGVPEPVADGPEADDETALILMPGLAFDPEGRRCGYGMIAFLGRPFSVTDAYFRMLL